MKRLSILVMVIFILSCSFHACSANDGQITEREARLLAWKYLLERSSMPEDMCQLYEIMEISEQEYGNGEPVWLVRMIGENNDHRYAYNTYTLYIHRITGECLSLDFPAMKNPITMAFIQLQNEQHKGDLFVRWTIWEKYEFKQTFSKLYEDFLLNPPEGNYITIDEHTLKLIQTDYRLPDKACVSQDEATVSAQRALLTAGKVTERDLDGHYINTSSFLYSNEFNPGGQLVWKIFFIPTPPVSPDYGYYVEVDAYSGEALGFVHQIQSEQNPWAYAYE